MIHNDVLRSVRYMLDISDKKVIEIIKLGGLEVSLADLAGYLKKDEEEGFVFCPDEVMAHFLDGLVIFKRGKDESRPPQPIEVPVTNNIILKKLRVAFELKEDDLHAILKAADFPVSKPETERPVSQVRSHQLPSVWRPVAAQLSQGADAARQSLNNSYKPQATSSSLRLSACSSRL